MDFRKGYFTSRINQSLNEAIDREEVQRHRWHQNLEKIKQKYPQKEYFSKNFIYQLMHCENDIERYRFRLPQITIPPKRVDYQKDIDAYLTRIGVRQPDGTFSTVFINQATDEIKSLLQYGVSHDSNGRGDYLRQRALIKPEEKHKFPTLSSMDYGWRLKDYENVPGITTHAQKKFYLRREIDESFYRSNGAFYQMNEGPIKTRDTPKVFDGVK